MVITQAIANPHENKLSGEWVIPVMIPRVYCAKNMQMQVTLEYQDRHCTSIGSMDGGGLIRQSSQGEKMC
jgi:hypothetical protein